MQSHRKYELLYFIKHKNDMHAPAVIQKLLDCLAFELSKLRFIGHNYIIYGFLIKCVIDEAGVWDVQPLEIWVIMFCKV